MNNLIAALQTVLDGLAKDIVNYDTTKEEIRKIVIDAIDMADLDRLAAEAISDHAQAEVSKEINKQCDRLDVEDLFVRAIKNDIDMESLIESEVNIKRLVENAVDDIDFSELASDNVDWQDLASDNIDVDALIDEDQLAENLFDNVKDDVKDVARETAAKAVEHVETQLTDVERRLMTGISDLTERVIAVENAQLNATMNTARMIRETFLELATAINERYGATNG